MGVINAIGRKITGDPCIGCDVRNEAFFPERLATNEGHTYVRGREFLPTEYTAQLVANTCELALDPAMSTRERFEACRERRRDPEADVKAVALTLGPKATTAAETLPLDDTIVTSEADGHRMLSMGYVQRWLGDEAPELADFAILSGHKRADIHPNDERNEAAETALITALEAAGAFAEKDT